MTTAPAPAPTYTITFDRIGRHHQVPPLERIPAEDGDELARIIYRYARKYLGSREVQVVLDEDGTGMILVGGFRNGGSLLWTCDDTLPRPVSPEEGAP